MTKLAARLMFCCWVVVFGYGLALGCVALAGVVADALTASGPSVEAPVLDECGGM